MTILHNSKSANVFNFLAMNRVITQISRPMKTESDENVEYLYISNSAFLTFFNQLNEKEVKYIVTGNLAVAFHGVIMPSSYLEIWAEADKENIEKLESITSQSMGKHRKVIDSTINSLGEKFPLKVHLELNYFPAKKFNWCYVKSETSIASGVSIPILSLDDLIVEKTASNDPEDMEIVEALENMSW
ncbi:hypothetical protein GCM10009122_49120 [Fulvivirga kasyanovii]|uniref:Uncharacterized protein n=1 Tax=Fulvivirga kasyanovii TaxID=396812 RepID=A0ABW9RKV3_9BACT|nr:hypothetical protein [Fulvivirga kasyanovii]MTI24601.1 hypothetical protein [Fulvivirga kasyanovii]